MATGYLSPVLTPGRLKIKVNRIIKTVKQQKNLKFDAIACRGLSGFLITPPVAILLKKKIIAIRKNKHNCHSDCVVEFTGTTKRYIIIDDRICTGKTLDITQRMIRKHVSDRAQCVGIYIYDYFRSVKGVRWSVNSEYEIPIFYI